MPDNKKEPYDLTEEASKRRDDASTCIAREAESDDVNENTGLGNVVSPDEDEAGENRVSTSLSDD